MNKSAYIEEVGNTNRSITYKKDTCGSIYIIVAYREEEPERVDYIRIIASTKPGACAASFLEALADTLTFSIRRIRNEYEARAIVKNLRFHKCLNCPANKDHITSCSDAIGQVLEKVLKINEPKAL
ncbi:MAG: hypothetical protein WC312_03745 [Candidatus Omnitrophota bacterium]|jgi:hypothetical protein